MKGKIWMCAVLMGICIGAVPHAEARDDFQYWPRFLFKLYNGEKFAFNLYSEGWIRDDASRLELFLISPKLVYKAHKNLNLQANYTYVGFRGPYRDDFHTMHRIEGEVNPHWTFKNGWKFITRNRIEYRWIENQGWDNTRMRNRLRLSIPTKNFGPMKSIYADTEFFINFRKEEHDEQRTTPIGLNFRVLDPLDFQVFWMIQSKRFRNDWYSNQILGTMLTYRFY